MQQTSQKQKTKNKTNDKDRVEKDWIHKSSTRTFMGLLVASRSIYS